MRGIIPSLIFLLLCRINSQAQEMVTPVPYSVAGAVYTQNFDGLPSSGSFSLAGKGPFNLSAPPVNATNLTGWQLQMIAGSSTNAAFATGTGSSTGHGLYSLGMAASSERALGSLSSGSGIYAMGIVLTNQTGGVLNTVTISFTAEQWRKGGSTNKNTCTFHYKTGLITHIDQTGLSDLPSLNFSSLIATASAAGLNGNLPENRETISQTFNNLLWKPGEQLLLRWDDADETGSDDVIALDNFSFSATLASSLPAISASTITGITEQSAVLNALVNDQYAVTSVLIEFDTSTQFPSPIIIHPSPDTLLPGSGNTPVLANLTGLAPGTTYYFRYKANNGNGTTTGSVQSFATIISLPTITTIRASAVTTNTAVMGGNVTTAGGAMVIEKGIVWSIIGTPTISDNKINMGSGAGSYSQSVNGLPQGTLIYARAYAMNAGGTSYGDTVRFVTQTLITSLNTTSLTKTNSVTVTYLFNTAQNIAGLSAANFLLVSDRITNPVITGITGSANAFSITVNTGSGSGTLALHFINDNGLSVPINNKPYASNVYSIDKETPLVTNVSIPDKTMKTGDTVAVTVFVKPDPDAYKIASGNINGFNLSGFNKKNDSVYTCWFVIANGGKDVEAANDIAVSISLQDSVGNTGTYQSAIKQAYDMIDANKPFIAAIRNPPNGIFKTGDTLFFNCRFNEKIFVSGGVPSITLTVGSSSRTALYINGSGSDSLLFRYIIGAGNFDTDGIKTAGTITLNNSVIKDNAGNLASVGFNNTLATKDILIDAIAPVITNINVPAAAVYKTGNVLDFVINYSKKVFVANTTPPFLSLSIGAKIKTAVVINGSGSTALLFRYIIQADDVDTDGIQLVSPVNDVAMTIKDSVGNSASTLLNNPGSMTGVQINPPTILMDHIIVPENATYTTGDTLEFMITYNENVFISVPAGLPSIKITIGSTSKQAIYTEGSGTNHLLFAYIIQPGDEDTDGIRINNSISLNNSSIKDAMGNNAPVNFLSATSDRILIDAVAPIINNVQTPLNNIYKAGDTLTCMINFSEPVYLRTGTEKPYLKTIIGSADKKMSYLKGSGTVNLFFSYTIQYGDLDKNGIGIGSALTLNSSSIKDSIGNNAIVSFKINTALTDVKVDAVSPVFTVAKTDTIELCANSSAITISNVFAVTDEEPGELVSWKIRNNTRFGTLSLLSYATSSNGKNIIPAGIVYTPFINQPGVDTIFTEITDGINTSQKKILIVILPAIQNNLITAEQTICVGQVPSILQGTQTKGGNGIYRYQWDFATDADSLRFIALTVNSSLQNYAPASLNNNTWLRRRVLSGPCSDTSSAIKITIVKNGLWTGNQDTDWNNQNNWCGNTLPNSSTDVLIYANALHQPVVRDSAKCNRLLLPSGTRLTINGSLELNGNIIGNHNSINAEKGTLVLNGTTMQEINGNLFEKGTVQNMLIQNSTGIALVDDVTITGNVVINDGSLQTNDHLTLKQGAVIGPCANGTSIKGNVSLEHFIKTGNRTFHLIGNPFSDDMGLQMVADSLDITGYNGSLNGFTATATNEPSAFRYDFSAGNDSSGIESGWVPFTHTNGSAENTWKKNTGIRLWVRGRRGQGLDGTPPGNGSNGTYLPLPVMLKLSGTLNTGNREIFLQKDVYAGYHVIANPYASNIDLSRISHGSDIGNYYWLWNPQQGKQGGYTSFPFRTKNTLPPFAAFIARANGNNSNSLLFTEHCKTTDTASENISAIMLDDIFYLELRLQTDSIFWDRLILLQMDSARTNFDRNDAEKFTNPEVSFYSLSKDQRMLSIDARPLNNESVIPLGIQVNEPGSFSIHVAQANLPGSVGLLLHDRYLEKWSTLQKDSTYHFNITTDTASSGNRRFEISTPQKPVDAVISNAGILVKINPVPAKDKIVVQYKATESGNTSIRILSLAGTPLKNIQLGLQKEGQVSIPVSDLPSGLYLLEIKCGNKSTTKKIIKE